MSSTLKDRLVADMKSAMKQRDKDRLGTIRLALAALKQKEVDERVELNDTDVLTILTKMVKQRRESIRQYQDAGRDDLVAQEELEISVLADYLPQPLSETEIAALIDQAINETGASSMQDMGKVMGMLKPKVQGRADMSQLSGIIRNRLNA